MYARIIYKLLLYLGSTYLYFNAIALEIIFYKSIHFQSQKEGRSMQKKAPYLQRNANNNIYYKYRNGETTS